MKTIIKTNNVKKVFKTRYVYVYAYTVLLLTAAAALVGLSACNPATDNIIPSLGPTQLISYTDSNYSQLLDDTFRIDIKNIAVSFDYTPNNQTVNCHAVVDFQMRTGQTHPLIHLNPVLSSRLVSALTLNGENLNFNNEADVKTVSFIDTPQRAIEFQRDLGGGTHTLDITYQLKLNQNYAGFATNVNDLNGFGNETLFPTLNTPHELARHHLTFRVHSDDPFRCIGSGLVQKQSAGNVQEWTLDTEREIASYTIMFFLAPEADTNYEERTIAGVDVRVIAYKEPNVDLFPEFFNILGDWLPELIQNVGPFPMPRGLSVFLTGASGGGMEYFGGTMTSIRALEHEVFHMYYACSTVNSTYRDSWLDEAVNMWYELSKEDNFPAIGTDFSSGIVSDRSPIGVGFDRRAYDEGARIIQAVAQQLGGREQMTAFLRQLHADHSFEPFDTLRFLDYVNDYSGVDMKPQFMNWVYHTSGTSAASVASQAQQPLLNFYHQKIDLTPPQHILDKYKE